MVEERRLSFPTVNEQKKVLKKIILWAYGRKNVKKEVNNEKKNVQRKLWKKGEHLVFILDSPTEY